MPEGFADLAFGPVDNPLEGFIEHLVGGIAEHHQANRRNKGRSNKGGDLQQRRSNFLKDAPALPAHLLIDAGGGHGEGFRVPVHLVELLQVQVLE